MMNGCSIRYPIWAILIVTCIVALPWCLSCSKRTSPENEIRLWLDQAVGAAEKRDAGSLRDLMSDDYSDDEGRDKRLIHGLLVYHLRSNRSIYLLTKVKGIKLVDPRAAELTVAVAVAGQPIGSGVDLSQVRADLLRFDFRLEKDKKDNWRVIAAKWESIGVTEFL